MGYGKGKGLGKVLKHVRDKYMHQVPTGPHTDVKRYKINPSLKKNIRPVPLVPLVPTTPKLPKALKDKLKKSKK